MLGWIMSSGPLQGIMWAALAATGVLTMEWIYKKHPGEFPLMVLPFLILTQPLLYKMYHGGPTLLISVTTFGLFAALGRMALSHWILGEAVVRGNMVAGILALVAVVVGYLWR